MECPRIQDLLSDYIDGTLIAETKSVVEDHLSSCPVCRKELDALKSLIQELGSLESVEPPKNFLHQVHKRIEQRSGFSKLLQMLFFPLRIKIPLQFAAAATTAVLVFFVFHTIQPPKQIEEALTISRKVETSDRIMADAVKPSIKKEAHKSKSILKGAATAPAIVDKIRPIEIALLIHEKTPVMDHETKEDIKAPASMSYASKPKMARRVAPRVNLEAGRVEETEQTAALPLKERLETKDEGTVTTSDLEETLLKVKNSINLSEGKVISIEYEKETGLPRYITAEIPAEKYNAFLEKVNQIGTLQTPFPAKPQKDQKRVQIRIRLILP